LSTVTVAQARDLWANKPGTATMQNAAVATGNGTALPVSGYGAACCQVTGTFVGTVVFEGTADGVNWVAIPAIARGASMVFSASAPGLYDIDCRGLVSIRARISSYTSGSITVVGVAEPFAGAYRPAVQDVALSGSYIANESKIVSSLAVAAGAEVNAVQNVPTNCSYISFGIVDQTEDGAVTFRYWPQVYGGPATQTAGGAIDIFSNVYLGNCRAVSTPIRPKSLVCDLRIKNERASSNTYDIYIYRHYESKA